MPIFFFDFREGEKLSIDDVGIEFPDVETAYLEAFRAAQEIWFERLRQRQDPLICAFEIRDSARNLLLVLKFDEILGTNPGDPPPWSVLGMNMAWVTREGPSSPWPGSGPKRRGTGAGGVRRIRSVVIRYQH